MSVNKVILLGNVGRDPEVKYMDSGVAVATFPLATSERGYTLQNGTQIPERTEWHNIVIWGKQAEVAEKYVHKGDKLYIEGKMRTRSYSDKGGIQRYVVEIFVENMEMLSPKGSSTGSSYAPAAQAPAQAPVAQPKQASSFNEPENSADDLPF